MHLFAGSGFIALAGNSVPIELPHSEEMDR